VYNDSSCVACHNLGATGGAGPASKNVDIITASPNGIVAEVERTIDALRPGFLGRALGSLVGRDDSADAQPAAPAPRPMAGLAVRRRPDTRELIRAHPGFRTARSVVVHRFGTESGYESWRQGMLGFGGNPSSGAGSDGTLFEAMNSINMSRSAGQTMVGQFVLVRSQRNPTPLFGAGLIDAIPDRALEEAARAKHSDFPDVAGRVSQLKDGRIGRFGWKAQTPSLRDFVLTACAVELGLEVPGHHQGGVPQRPNTTAKGLDLTAEECNDLVAYVRDLPRPVERRPPAASDAREIDAGRRLFAAIGCATCHTPRLGEVDGIYSDLLLHDLGQTLGDTGQYSVFDPSSSEEEFVDEGAGPIAKGEAAAPPESPSRRDPLIVNLTAAQRTPPSPAEPATMKRPTTGPASRFEWRTPPLWGFRDSGPYLHDGRADTLEQAVALHGGEAAGIARSFFGLRNPKRRQIEAFLKSLSAPPPDAAEQVAATN
jgi:mono/diheme cytochrome c family protein